MVPVRLEIRLAGDPAALARACGPGAVILTDTVILTEAVDQDGLHQLLSRLTALGIELRELRTSSAAAELSVTRARAGGDGAAGTGDGAPGTGEGGAVRVPYEVHVGSALGRMLLSAVPHVRSATARATAVVEAAGTDVLPRVLRGLLVPGVELELLRSTVGDRVAQLRTR